VSKREDIADALIGIMSGIVELETVQRRIATKTEWQSLSADSLPLLTMWTDLIQEQEAWSGQHAGVPHAGTSTLSFQLNVYLLEGAQDGDITVSVLDDAIRMAILADGTLRGEVLQTVVTGGNPPQLIQEKHIHFSLFVRVKFLAS